MHHYTDMRCDLLLLSALLASLPLAAQPAPSDSAVAGNGTVAPAPVAAAKRPGSLWGTVIRRDEFKPLTGKERWGLYWRQTYWTPGVYVRAAGIGALDQWKNEPAAWGQGAEAYFKRVGNAYGRAAIDDSLEAAGAALLKHDVRYIKCGCTGVFKRAGHAIGTNFVTLNKNGRWVPAYARFGAAVGSQYIGNTWMPDGYRNWNTSLRDGAQQFAFGSAFNLVREFVTLKKH